MLAYLLGLENFVLKFPSLIILSPVVVLICQLLDGAYLSVTNGAYLSVTNGAYLLRIIMLVSI